MLSPSCFSCKTMLMGTDGVHCLCGISIHYKCLKSAGDISQSWGNNNSPSSLMKTILNSSAFRYKCLECRTYIPSVSNPPNPLCLHHHLQPPLKQFHFLYLIIMHIYLIYLIILLLISLLSLLKLIYPSLSFQ